MKSGAGGYCYRYNGIELNEDIGLYDYGARYYDPATARWNAVDPLAEKYTSLTPYHYTANNPIKYVDYDGMDFGINVDDKNKTITISQIFYSDGSEDIIALLNNVKETFESKNGQFGFETKEGVYAINFDITVDNGGGKRSKKARADKEGNSMSLTKGFSVLEELAGVLGRTQEGGDYTRVKEGGGGDGETEQKVANHEVLHTQGIDHKLIGKQGFFIDERTIGTTLNYSNSNGNSGIKVKGSKKKWQFRPRSAIDRPEVLIHESRKMKGRVIKIE